MNKKQVKEAVMYWIGISALSVAALFALGFLAGSGNTKSRYQITQYLIIFHPYKDESKPVSIKEKLLDGDPCLAFGKREIRDEVLQAIQQLTKG